MKTSFLVVLAATAVLATKSDMVFYKKAPIDDTANIPQLTMANVDEAVQKPILKKNQSPAKPYVDELLFCYDHDKDG